MIHSARASSSVVRLLALLAGAAPWAAPVGAQRPLIVASAPAALAVPFVPQGELLCGGAAVAMVLRWHGERGARSESFAPLVRAGEGGIRTDELAAEVARRGWPVRAGAADRAALEAALAAGQPPIVLLASRPGRWHYVVVVAVGPDEVRVHDPARAPDVRIPADEFAARWSAGGSWAMRVGAKLDLAPPVQQDGADAAAPPALVRASDAFRAGDWSAASEAAIEATRAEPADPRGWRLLGSSLYLADRPDQALDAWGRAGEPRLDGLAVTGLARTRHPVVHELVGLIPGTVLERAELMRARRRLALLPGASLTRLGYRARAGGWVEAEAVVVEGAAHPFSRAGLATALVAAAGGEWTAWENGMLGAGERLDLRWRRSLERGGGVQLAVPGGAGWPGRTEVGAAWLPGDRAAWLRATDWAASWLRWEAGARVDRTDDGTFRPALTAALAAAGPGDRMVARVGGSAWPGERRAGLIALDLGAQLGGPEHRWSAIARAGARAASSAAPSALRPEAGASGERALGGPFSGPDPAPLLRAHGRLDGARLLHGGIEATRWAGAPVRLGLAAFVDAARTDPSAGWTADAGVGVRIALPALAGAVRLDHAWSLTDGARGWSVGWSLFPGAMLGP